VMRLSGTGELESSSAAAEIRKPFRYRLPAEQFPLFVLTELFVQADWINFRVVCSSS
jgi:hypothetical protein